MLRDHLNRGSLAVEENRGAGRASKLAPIGREIVNWGEIASNEASRTMRGGFCHEARPPRPPRTPTRGHTRMVQSPCKERDSETEELVNP